MGYAKLISQDVPALESADLREIRNRERRIERRKRKLKEELIEIEQQELQLIHQQPTKTTFLEFLSATEPSLKPAQPQHEEELDPIKLLGGGS